MTSSSETGRSRPRSSPPAAREVLHTARWFHPARLDAWLSTRSPAVALAVALGLEGVVAIGDFATGASVSFTLLHLVPIAVGVWYVSARVGQILAVASALSWLMVDLNTNQLTLHPVVQLWNFAMQVGVFLVFARITAALKRRLSLEESLARTDALTGVANRRGFEEAAERELARARRTRTPVTIAYLDLDDFKRVNDQRGHAEGDRVLRQFAQTLQASLRRTDLVGRLGGDEFAVLLPDTEKLAAEGLLERVRGSLGRAEDEVAQRVTFSLGGLTFSVVPPTLAEALSEVDQVMYAVKAGGKASMRLA